MTFSGKISSALNMLINLLAMISAFILASYLITGVTTGKPSFLGYRVMWVRSPSMEPQIKTGDFVLVKTVNPNDLSIGDIAVYRKMTPESKLTHFRIIHRIINKSADGKYIFKGDNNPEEDYMDVYPYQIEYKAVYVL